MVNMKSTLKVSFQFRLSTYSGCQTLIGSVPVTARLIKLRNEKRITYYEDSKLRKEEEGKEAVMLPPTI
jgi:hypothetical protein